MNLYIASYVDLPTVEAEMEDSSVDAESMACPQFSHVLTSLDHVDVVLKQARDEYEQFWRDGEDDGEENNPQKLVWKAGEHNVPENARENWTWHLVDDKDEVFVIVIVQKVMEKEIIA